MNANTAARSGDETDAGRFPVVDETSVLVTGGSAVQRAEALCGVAIAAQGRGRDALVVTANRGSSRLRGELPDGVAVVDCTPSGGAADGSVESVGSPADLTGNSMSIARFLDAAGPKPLVVIDSLSTLLVYADDERVFRFLHTLSEQVRSVGGGLVVGLNAASHDVETLRRFQQLFDGHVELEADGGVEVRGI